MCLYRASHCSDGSLSVELHLLFNGLHRAVDDIVPAICSGQNPLATHVFHDIDESNCTHARILLRLHTVDNERALTDARAKTMSSVSETGRCIFVLMKMLTLGKHTILPTVQRATNVQVCDPLRGNFPCGVAVTYNDRCSEQALP